MQDWTQGGGRLLCSQGAFEDCAIEAKRSLVQTFMGEPSSKRIMDVMRLDAVEAVWVVDIAVYVEEDLQCQIPLPRPGVSATLTSCTFLSKISTSLLSSDLAVSRKRSAEAYAPVLIAARLSRTLSMSSHCS